MSLPRPVHPLFAILLIGFAVAAPGADGKTKSSIDELIPWLLREDHELR